MPSKKTLPDQFFTKLANNPVVAALIISGTIVVGLATFTDSLDKLLDAMPKPLKPPIVNLNGYWVTHEDSDNLSYFYFHILDNRLFGTLRLPYVKTGIINGQVYGDRISFQTPPVRETRQTQYEGKILSPEKIRFLSITDEGFSEEFNASKIVDKSNVHAAGDATEYKLAYEIPGRGESIFSISVGPEEGKYDTGGLRLVSGDDENCQMIAWDLATGEMQSHSAFCESQPLEAMKGRITVSFKPWLRDPGILDLLAVVVAQESHQILFEDRNYSEFSLGRGQRRFDMQENVNHISISSNLNRVATAEGGGPGGSSVKFRYQDGEIARSFDVAGTVGAIALNWDGSLLAVAEAADESASVLTLYDTEGGTQKWAVTLRGGTIGALCFSPDGEMLASGGAGDGRIYMWNVAEGRQTNVLGDTSEEEVSLLKFRWDGEAFAVVRMSASRVEVWDTSSLSLSQRLENEELVGDFAFSPDGRVLAVGGAEQGVIRVWTRPNLSP